MPKASASPGATRPAGTGRPCVRAMRASMSASYHMLSAPAAPAPTAMQISAVDRDHRMQMARRDQQPTNAVKTTSDITRGFISAM